MLPGTLRIAEVHCDVSCHREALVIGEFEASVPGQRLVEFLRQLLGLLDQCLDDSLRVAAGDLGEHQGTRLSYDAPVISGASQPPPATRCIPWRIRVHR